LQSTGSRPTPTRRTRGSNHEQQRVLLQDHRDCPDGVLRPGRHPDPGGLLHRPRDGGGLILIYRFHRAAGEEIAERPLIDGAEPHGIFATRHFNRPNRLGISVVRLAGIDGATLAVEGVDLLDGTPVLDIKPYIPAFDSIGGATSGWVTPQHVGQIKRQSASFQVD